MLGLWLSHFAINFWKPYVLNQDINVKSNHKQQALNSVAITSSVILLSVGLFLHVDKNVVIPDSWIDNSKQICPHLRQGHLLHYNTMAGVGYTGFFMMFYLYKAYRASTGNPIHFKWKEGDVETQATKLEIVLKLAFLVAADNFFTSFLPILVYGHKDIPLLADFFLKKMLYMTFIVFVFHSDTFDRASKRVFRPHLVNSEPLEK